MARKYDADSITVIESDLERVQKRPTMYIPSTGVEGAIHIPFEIIDNSIDEVTVEDSVGTTVTTDFDTKTKVFTIVDDGSGIPQGKMLEVCTIINSSGKFNNGEDSAYQFSGGTNGVGLKLSVFLSEWCEVTSEQDGNLLQYRFENGKLAKTTKGKTTRHGSTVKFKMSDKFVAVKDIKPADIIARYEEKAYLFPTAKLILTISEDGKVKKTYTYGGKDIADRVRMWKPDTEIIRVSDTAKVTTLRNISDDDLSEVKVIVDVAFAFKEDALDAEQDKFVISYGNTIKTYTGGSHVDGLKQGIQKFFKTDVIPNLKGKDKDLAIMPTDMTAGLCAFVVAKVYEPEFRGQYKDQLSNPEVRIGVRNAVYEALRSKKSSVVNPMIDFVKRVTRGRMASKKTRKKDVSNIFSKDRNEKFRDIIYTTATTSPELILLEGDSAADNAAMARDSHNQAIYSVRKPKNVFDTASDDVMQVKSTFTELMDICGIEPGKKCDPSKSTMRMILTLTDGDVDGDYISITTTCLLAKHCRPLIDAGMVGRILPPIYAIPKRGKKGEYKYVRSQREFFNEIVKEFIKNVEVSLNGRVLSKEELYALLSKNFNYDRRLESLSDRQCCEPRLMEYIAWKYHGSWKDQKKSYWMNALKQYPEIKVLMEPECLILDGDIPGYDYLNMGLDEYFDRHVKKFKVLQAENDSIYGYSLNGEKDKTLYDVMRAFRSYIPPDVKRFKGLGELDPKELRSLCMDPEKRTVIIFKFDDFEKDMDKINVMLSTKAIHAEARKKLLGSMYLDDLDLDT